MSLGVAAAAAVAQGQIEHAVGAEGELAAVVVGEGLGNRQQHLFAGGQGEVWVGGDQEPAQHRGAVAKPAVVKIEIALLGIVGGKGKTQQPLFAGVDQAVGNVDEGGGQQGAGRQNANLPRLLHQEQPVAAVAGMADGGRCAQAAGHRGETET